VISFKFRMYKGQNYLRYYIIVLYVKSITKYNNLIFPIYLFLRRGSAVMERFRKF